MRACLASLIAVLCAGIALAAPVMTAFDPATDGFRFANDFVNELSPAIAVRTEGLCGGMTYAALDYYNAHRPIPPQDWRPANGTLLQQYLYARQIDSLVQNIGKWTSEGDLFAQSLDAGPGGCLAELRSFLDKGMPVPLGLRSARGWNTDHQVLAVGYDIGPDQQGFTIFLCDPNHPGKTMRLTPNVARRLWVERKDNGAIIPGAAWLGYFVATNYEARKPPRLLESTYPADGKVHELLLTVKTGAHELRGGKDNVDLVVDLADGTRDVYENINLSARWLAKYEETAAVRLRTPVAADQIKDLVLTATFGGDGDPLWDLQSVRVRGRGGGLDLPSLAMSGAHQFSSAQPGLVLAVTAPAGQ